ncbi:hypothetical protein SPBR_09084 [Sporothrix brasiliensis 5110]|uniref:Uncharacterized protein n=1 Tax=Sporothrix brasiliensis 5110 TaxID=1398154 RepID=A0A0C2J323_9PEZI|nr:uncharacterized protein SPBR_09084 [Sporothrix brasiliensis 5110]KIH91467.1 hypothetical protein SPBR_09084 [Sporothrix brasiliensis 5110]
MIRLNPTALSVTVEDVNNLVISKQRVIDRSEEQPPYTAAQASASPTAASTKDGQPDASPLQARAEPEMDDSYMEDVPHPVPALTETRTRGGNSSKNSQTAGDSEAGHAAERSEDPPRAHQQPDVFPPTGRDREPADFKIFEEPSRVVRVSRREFEQFFGGVNAGSDDDVPDVLEEVV